MNWPAIRSRWRVELRRARGPFLVLAGGVVLALAALVVLASRMNTTLPGESTREFLIAVDDATGVHAGMQEIRWAGVPVGRITGVELRSGRPVLEVAVERTDLPLYRDARVRLRPQTALEDLYLDVESRGTPRAGELGEGEVLTAARTREPVHVGRVLNVFSEDTRARLEQLIDELGAGLPDRGARLRETFAAFVPFLDGQARLFRTIARRERLTRRLMSDFRVLVDELGRREAAIARLVERGGSTFQAVASRQGDLERLIAELPATVDQLRGSLTRVQDTMAELQPALEELRPAAARLPGGLRALRSFSRAALPAVRALDPAVSALRPAVRDLVPTAALLDESLARLEPQLGRLDRMTEKVEACERSLSKFFAWTLSVFKMGNKQTRASSPRGTLIVGSDAISGQFGPDPLLKPVPGCAGGMAARPGRGG